MKITTFPVVCISTGKNEILPLPPKIIIIQRNLPRPRKQNRKHNDSVGKTVSPLPKSADLPAVKKATNMENALCK